MSLSHYGYRYFSSASACTIPSVQPLPSLSSASSLASINSSAASFCDPAINSSPAAAAAIASQFINGDTSSQAAMYGSGLLASYPRVAALQSAADVYSSAAYAAAGSGYMPFGSSESSAFYSPLSAECSDTWRNLSQPSSGWPYDPTAMPSYPYGPSYTGLDVRRKNATRESTSTLKAWLYEHIKNPYPTKGEKIMLAIITKMTLTQVSTWFANARRRLKKENKMQWSPRNRTDNDDDEKSSSEDEAETEGKERKRKMEDEEDIVVDSGGMEDPVLSNSDCSLPDVTVHGPCRQESSSKPLTDGAHSGRSLCGNNNNSGHLADDGCIQRNNSSSFCVQGLRNPRNLPGAAFYFSFQNQYGDLSGGGNGLGSGLGGGGGFIRDASGMYCRPTSVDSNGELHSEIKPRIWSLADVATSNRQSTPATSLPVRGGVGPGGVMGPVNGPQMLDSLPGFQPWNNGPYCDVDCRADENNYCSMMTSHPAIDLTQPTGSLSAAHAQNHVVSGAASMRTMSSSGTGDNCSLSVGSNREGNHSTSIKGYSANRSANSYSIHGDESLRKMPSSAEIPSSSSAAAGPGGVDGVDYYLGDPSLHPYIPTNPTGTSQLSFKPFVKRLQ